MYPVSCLTMAMGRIHATYPLNICTRMDRHSQHRVCKSRIPNCLEIVGVEIAVGQAVATLGDCFSVHLVVEDVDGVLGHGVAQLVLQTFSLAVS